MPQPARPKKISSLSSSEETAQRYAALTSGALAMPNLSLISSFTVFLLYGLLTVVLIVVVELGYLNSEIALVIGVGIAVLNFIFGPWLMDLCLRWLYTIEWIQPSQLPPHLKEFVNNICRAENMKFPSFGIIDDGAPQAFTYGHHPNNARIVISRGLTELLLPDELEAVTAHEIGHAHNWDMALMTIVNLVPLLLYYIYRSLAQAGKKKKGGKSDGSPWPLVLGVYLLYITSEYIVLWFSRTREYYADRFSGLMTGNPSLLARALVKIAYGLASQNSSISAKETSEEEEDSSLSKSDRRRKMLAGAGALGVLNIFDRQAALNLVMSSASGTSSAGGLNIDSVKDAMQWDLWNPWAAFFEINSTHPLVAKRLQRLAGQAVAMGKEPLVIFDRRKPESYWDEFAVDVTIMFLPLIGFLSGSGILFLLDLDFFVKPELLLGIPLTFMGLGSLVKTFFRYKADSFPLLTVDKLIAFVKVSPVRPVAATVTGTIIGKGVPGLIYSEDFVLRDSTGILFLDYKQPVALWNSLFGLLKAGEYQGKNVRVSGWFRRAPIPYLEISRIETVNGILPPRKCYSSIAALIWAVAMIIIGFVFMMSGVV